MSNTKNLANLAAALDDGTSGQVLQSTGSGGVAFADAGGSGVTVHANQTAMLDDAGSADEGSLHYETGTNKLYVKQSSGFYMLAEITNVAPTINSFSEATGGATANDLTADDTFTLTAGSNTVITINATDADLETISYSATVTSGTATDVFTSPSFPVTNQSSNQFTLTPVTSGSGGTVTIRFDASDGTNVGQVSHSFAIAFTIADSHYTALLLATDGSAGDNQDDISDSSSNDHPITVNGDAHAGTFSPYRPGGYSTYLPGTENSISFDHHDSFNLGSGNFTIEFSIYFPSNVSATDYLFQHGEAGGSWNINTYNGYVFLFLNGLSIGNDIIGDSSYTISSHLNEWINYAIVRSGNTVTMYRNGTSVATKTSAQNANVGATLDTTNSEYLHINRRKAGTGNGAEFYFKDFRVTKGLARTISNNTGPLTSDENTSILVGSLPYIGDASSNNHTPTFIGSPSTKPIGPYDYTEYSESDHGGSVYFDGSGDYLSLSSSSDFTLDGDFTIDFWVNVLDSNIGGIVSSGQTSFVSGATALIWDHGTQANKLSFWAQNISSSSLVATNTLALNTWHFISLVRDNGVITIYQNGSSVSTYNSSSTISLSASGMKVGAYWNGEINAYITDFRIVKGTAVYTGNFTPPTGPLTTTGGTYPSTTNVNTSITASNTSLLLSGTDAHVLDKSQSANLKLVGAAAVTNATNNSNISSTNAVYFDGTDDKVQFNTVSLPDDFTVEYWLKLATYNDDAGIFGYTGTTNSQHRVNHNGTFGRIMLYINAYVHQTNSCFTQSEAEDWMHIAYARQNGTLKLYVNGFEKTSVSYTSAIDIDLIGAGGYNGGSNFLNGHLQDFRITNGKARYTAADETSNIPSAPLKG